MMSIYMYVLGDCLTATHADADFVGKDKKVSLIPRPPTKALRLRVALSQATSRFYLTAVEKNRENFLHGCDIKSGSGLGTRLLRLGLGDKATCGPFLSWTADLNNEDGQ